MFIQHDVANVRLNPRNFPDEVFMEGRPQIAGRILSVTDDKKCARVAWRMTAGAVRMSGMDPDTSDLMYVIDGSCELRIDGGETIVCNTGDWVEAPHEDFELHVADVFHKLSIIYNPNGVPLEPED